MYIYIFQIVHRISFCVLEMNSLFWRKIRGVRGWIVFSSEWVQKFRNFTNQGVVVLSRFVGYPNWRHQNLQQQRRHLEPQGRQHTRLQRTHQDAQRSLPHRWHLKPQVWRRRPCWREHKRLLRDFDSWNSWISVGLPNSSRKWSRGNELRHWYCRYGQDHWQQACLHKFFPDDRDERYQQLNVLAFTWSAHSRYHGKGWLWYWNLLDFRSENKCLLKSDLIKRSKKHSIRKVSDRSSRAPQTPRRGGEGKLHYVHGRVLSVLKDVNGRDTAIT